MADTFKGIITADGKKRQLPYESVFGKPVADKTLAIDGAFADAKVVGDKFKKVNAEADSLKEDIGVVQDTTMIVTKSTNLYDESKATDGYRIAGGTTLLTARILLLGYSKCLHCICTRNITIINAFSHTKHRYNLR